MGRPKALNKTNGATPKVTKHNQTELTDEQLQALTAEHVRAYTRALSDKKECDAIFKNVCKVAKSEGVHLEDIKAYIAAGTEEGQAKLRADAARLERMSRWHEFPLGEQGSFFDEDPAVTTNRSYRIGKDHGMAGEKATPPVDCDHENYMAGWHAGQEAKLSAGLSVHSQH